MNKNKTINFIDVLMLTVALISFSGIILLCLNFFYPKLTVISGLFLSTAIILLFNFKKIQFPNLKTSLLISLLLLCALFFRTTPSLYIMGGEDQGIYVNMAAYYNTHHSTFIVDSVRASLPPSLVNEYDKTNQLGHLGTAHFPGIFIKNLSHSIYEFQFYPLHPIWMAIFANFFGDTEGVWSLVVFSLLSILFFSLICYQLSHYNFIAAILGGLLMAINPVHVFFSKFPVSEIPAMAFIMGGFYYLIIYWKLLTTEHKPKLFYLILSALLFSCSFFVRIDGFIIVTWLSGLFWLFILNRKYILKADFLLLYFVSVFSLYVLSVIYGLIWNRFYSLSIYHAISSYAFGGHGSQGLSALLMIYCMICLILWRIPLMSREQLAYYHKFINRVLVISVFLVMLLACYRLYQIAFTPILQHTRPHLHFPKSIGLDAIYYSSLIVLFHYISWVGSLFFIFVLITYFNKKPDVYTTALLLLTTLNLFYSTVENFSIAYQYFYLRFFLPNTLFCVLLMIVIKMAEQFGSHHKINLLIQSDLAVVK